MLSGYADMHVKSAIVKGLRRRGMDVVTVQERGRMKADDEDLLAEADSEGRLMITNDTDFLRIHSQWMTTGKSHSGIVYWHQNALAIGEAIHRLVRYATRTTSEVAKDSLKYL
jgi:predicted nuclease of predicted toxin-antitoxin system